MHVFPGSTWAFASLLLALIGLPGRAMAAASAQHEPLYANLQGEVPTIDISEGHESGNIGKNPIDLIWVTLKK